MKKFRIMLPVLAVVFAVAGAVAADFMPPIDAYYKINGVCQSNVATTEQSCFASTNTVLPLCTVYVSGASRQAYQSEGCTGILRYNP